MIDKRVVIFDFDDATTKHGHELVDASRLLMETYPSTRSHGTAVINPANERIMRRELLPWVQRVAGIRRIAKSMKAQDAEDLWYQAYTEYCELTGLPLMDLY